jgi:putative N6-adenine-specific DNA methylase
MEKLFAVCAPGLEPFTAQELEQLRLNHSRSPSLSRGPLSADGFKYEFGGIEFQGSLHDIYRANLHLRTASRLLVRLGEFNARGFPEFRRKASHLVWEKYLVPERPVALRVTCQKSRLYHEGAVSERVAGAIADRLGMPPSVQKYREDPGINPPQLIVVRLLDNLCTISIDSSGALLHRRGYRLATAKAPLRETLAAGLLMASQWDKTSPLLDPFCGSGTIPIEAALLARKVPPGYARRFAFMDWPDFDSKTWEKLLSEARSALSSDTPEILGSDRDAGAVEIARANAERAGVADFIEFSCKPVSAIEPPSGPGCVVTNPPYGVRLTRTKDLRNLYAQFGNFLRSRCHGWSVTMLCDSIQLIQNTGLGFDHGMPLLNSGIRVRLVRSTIKQGSTCEIQSQ